MNRWYSALVEASRVRRFANLMFADRWITSLSRAGMYPRWWGDDKGD